MKISRGFMSFNLEFILPFCSISEGKPWNENSGTQRSSKEQLLPQLHRNPKEDVALRV